MIPVPAHVVEPTGIFDRSAQDARQRGRSGQLRRSHAHRNDSGVQDGMAEMKLHVDEAELQDMAQAFEQLLLCWDLLLVTLALVLSSLE